MGARPPCWCLLVLLLAGCAAWPAQAQMGRLRGPKEMSSSVIMFSMSDMEHAPRQNGRVANYCQQIVANARVFNSKAVSFVMTQYWLPVERNTDPYNVAGYCYQADGGGPCLPFTKAAVDRFTELLKGCLRNAIEQGFETIMVTPHMDNSVSNYYWRNYLRMDPTLPVNGFSYWDIQLGPLAAAINANLRPGITFLFNMQGEMGTSLFGWPMQYYLLMQRARAAATAGKPQLSANVQMGFKLVVDTVYGVDNRVPVGDMAEQAKLLYRAADFVAISAYAALPTQLRPQDLQRSAQMVHQSLMALGLDLTTKPVYYGEYGVGGGTSQYCNQLARNAADAARTPMYGTCWQYSKAMDPWDNREVRDWLRTFYRVSTTWLATGTGPTWYIDGIFLWNLASWDVQGVHPLSHAGDGGTFKDSEVVKIISKHNNLVRLDQDIGTISSWDGA